MKLLLFISIASTSLDLLYKQIRIRSNRRLATVWGSWPEEWQVEFRIKPSRRSRKRLQDGNVLELIARNDNKRLLRITISRSGKLEFRLPTKTVRFPKKISSRSHTHVQISTIIGTSRTSKKQQRFLRVSINDKIVYDDPVASFGQGTQVYLFHLIRKP